MKTIRILTIGNSLTENALTHLAGIASGSSGVRLEVGRANLGGCSLEKHWNLAVYSERQPSFRPYKADQAGVAKPGMWSLQEALAAKPWDYVTLQQDSANSFRRETFQPYLDRLCGAIRRLAPQARLLLYQTWAYRADAAFLPAHGLTQEDMYERIRDNFLHFSGALDCGVIPGGEAIQRARRAEGRAFVWPDPAYDYQNARAPELPRQAHSLSPGWQWAVANTPAGIPELRNDTTHLDEEGCYLVGCVWFERLTGLSLHDSSFTPVGMQRETAAFFKTIAHDTVANRALYERVIA